MQSAEKSVRLPAFDGKDEDFELWWVRFKAYARVYKFVQALDNKPEPNLPVRQDAVLDETEDKAAIAARNRNDIAVANFTLAFTTSDLVNLVTSAVTTEYPGGLSWKIVAALEKRYKPRNVMTKIDLRRALNGVSMKANQDPTTLFEQMKNIQT